MYTRAWREGGKRREKRGMSGRLFTAADARVSEWDRLRGTWEVEGWHAWSTVWNLWAKRRGKLIHICTQLDRWGGIRNHTSVLGMSTYITHSYTLACTFYLQWLLRFLAIEQRNTWNATVHVRRLTTTHPDKSPDLPSDTWSKEKRTRGRDYVCVFVYAWSCFLTILL